MWFATSIEDRFALHKGNTSGFDYMRIMLAIAVVAWHSYGLTLGRTQIDQAMQSSMVALLVHSIIPAFFALSGFLVTASLYRSNSVKVYLTFRALRIFPALTVEVLLAALVLGPLITTLKLNSYFTHHQFFEYFTNIVGLVRFELPGLFEDNPYPRVVNGSLWTVPYELECYIYLVIFFLLGFFRHRLLVLAAFLVTTFAVYELGFTSAKGVIVVLKEYMIGKSAVEPNLQEATNAVVSISRILVLSFLAGSVIYAWRHVLPYHRVIAAIALGASIFLLNNPHLYFFSPIFIAYLTVWIGLQNPLKLNFLKRGDYSYGIYLYAFPIQQVVAQSGLAAGNYFVLFTLSLLLTSVFAIFSWHVIEKPCLGLKRHFI